MTVAALLTCYNRKGKTLRCLRSLHDAVPWADVYLVDDASTDGTAEAVLGSFPRTHVIHGTGNLFWSRGMYTAWVEALKGNYDLYLWLNDDVLLYSSFYTELCQCLDLCNGKAVVSGLIESADHSHIIYGGYDAAKRLIGPASTPQDITYMNGNVVLVPRCVVERIGILDPVYHHDLGDVDYGLTARKHGFRVVSTRVPVAEGYSNAFCRVRKWGVSLPARLKRLRAPQGSPPRIAFHFRRKHYGPLNAMAYVAYLYLVNLLPDVAVQAIWGEKYKDHLVEN